AGDCLVAQPDREGAVAQVGGVAGGAGHWGGSSTSSAGPFARRPSARSLPCGRAAALPRRGPGAGFRPARSCYAVGTGADACGSSVSLVGRLACSPVVLLTIQRTLQGFAFHEAGVSYITT